MEWWDWNISGRWNHVSLLEVCSTEEKPFNHYLILNGPVLDCERSCECQWPSDYRVRLLSFLNLKREVTNDQNVFGLLLSNWGYLFWCMRKWDSYWLYCILPSFGNTTLEDYCHFGIYTRVRLLLTELRPFFFHQIVTTAFFSFAKGRWLLAIIHSSFYSHSKTHNETMAFIFIFMIVRLVLTILHPSFYWHSEIDIDYTFSTSCYFLSECNAVVNFYLFEADMDRISSVLVLSNWD